MFIIKNIMIQLKFYEKRYQLPIIFFMNAHTKNGESNEKYLILAV